jgi:hypothetical protein
MLIIKKSKSKLKIRVNTAIGVRDKSTESIDISTSGSYNRYLKKVEKSEDNFDSDHLHYLKQTATFTPLAKETKSFITFTNINNPNKNNVLKKHIVPNTPTHKKENYPQSLHQPETKLTLLRNKSLGRLNVKEDENSKILKRPGEDSNRLPSVNSNSKCKKLMNLEINNIFNMADKYKEDSELQGKINDLGKIILDIKSVLKGKRNSLQTAPSGKHTRTISARYDKK